MEDITVEDGNYGEWYNVITWLLSGTSQTVSINAAVLPSTKLNISPTRP